MFNVLCVYSGTCTLELENEDTWTLGNGPKVFFSMYTDLENQDIFVSPKGVLNAQISLYEENFGILSWIRDHRKESKGTRKVAMY